MEDNGFQIFKESLREYLQKEIEASKHIIKTESYHMTPYAAGRLSMAAEIINRMKD